MSKKQFLSLQNGAQKDIAVFTREFILQGQSFLFKVLLAKYMY